MARKRRAARRQAKGKVAEPPKTYKHTKENARRADWRAALRHFSVQVREAYGRRLLKVILYGSRARRDAEWDSDVDVVVVLDAYDDFWAEVDRLSTLAGETLRDHGIVLSAMPATAEELEQSSKPIFENIRREGVLIS